LRLPHRQFVFTFPKALRVFFSHDRKLFAEISKMIFAMVRDFYREVTGKEILTGMVIAHQTFSGYAPVEPTFPCNSSRRRIRCRGEFCVSSLLRARENDRILQAHCGTILHSEESYNRAFCPKSTLLAPLERKY